MTNFRMLITHEGKHPPSKWADLAVDELMEISSQAPSALLKEAVEFRKRLHVLFVSHCAKAMDHEKDEISAGRHAHHLPYVTEDHSKSVVQDVVNTAKGTSFAEHFDQAHVQQHIENVCNHYFKSAKHVERQHFHAANAPDAKKTKKS